MNDALSPLERALVARGFHLIETHISRVFVGERDVYKFKRAVNLGFLDFTRAEQRRQACEAELVLNRRLAPGVYLDVLAAYLDARGDPVLVPASTTASGRAARAMDSGAPASAREQEPECEWAVHMRRLPDEERADQLLARGALSIEDMDRVAALLARFHREARSDPATAHFGSPPVIAGNVEENFAQVAATIERFVSRAEAEQLFAYQREFLREHEALLLARATAGKARDGHGDLRLEHLYRQPDGSFLAIDCIEFNERFRFADVCADLAFLAMDLAHHQRSDLAERLVASYARESGDYELYRLLDFYESYRAVVRAKVSSLLAFDAGVSEATREGAQREARRYYQLALAAAQRARSHGTLVVMAGGIASGKSTLAEALSLALDAPVLSADRLRKEQLGVAPTEARHDPSFGGAYSEVASERVYSELFARAEHVLVSGRSVILDASFRSRALRARARELAVKLGLPARFIECRCPRERALSRLAARAQGPSISDGRAEIYDDFAARFEPLTELAPAEHAVIDTSLPPEHARGAALAAVTAR